MRSPQNRATPNILPNFILGFRSGCQLPSLLNPAAANDIEPRYLPRCGSPAVTSGEPHLPARILDTHPHNLNHQEQLSPGRTSTNNSMTRDSTPALASQPEEGVALSPPFVPCTSPQRRTAQFLGGTFAIAPAAPTFPGPDRVHPAAAATHGTPPGAPAVWGNRARLVIWQDQGLEGGILGGEEPQLFVGLSDLGRLRLRWPRPRSGASSRPRHR